MRPPGEPLALKSLAWACAAFGGGLLLHIDRVPVWASLTCLALIVWRLAAVRQGLWLPGPLLRSLLALAMAAVVLGRFHTLNGLSAGTTLLLLMAALKLLETRRTRDELVLIGTGLFLLLAACLDRQDLGRVPLYGLQAWLCCTALATLATPSLPLRAAASLAGRTLLIAAPLAVALFVFFPRLPGSFWAIPRGSSALTGLSDSMSPGGISQLVADYSVAFRVKFTAPRPAGALLYWRGPVLHEFDGRTWRRTEVSLHSRPQLQFLGEPVRYRVALEPTRRRFWFALDLPAQAPGPRTTLTYDSQLIADEPVMEPIAYEALSYLSARALEPLGALARREDTALPGPANPRSRELARSLHDKFGSDAAYVSAVLDYLRSGGFVYSLEPQPLGADAVDELLFRTREGFCGHYASAFVVLMRAANVPARVVTGYLGGEWNPVGEFFEVRQADAHAWAEVWLEGRGWTRVDPTAVVAPERLTRGVMQLMPGAFSASERLLYGPGWLGGLLQRWEAASAWWSDHVVRFDYASQLNLLARFGIRSPDTRYLAWGFAAALGAWLLFIAWHFGRGRRRTRPDALARAYRRLCRKLARIAPARALHQGPRAYGETVLAERPDLRTPLEALLARYVQLRFGAAVALDAEVAEFARAVARWRIPAAPPEPLRRT